MAETGSRTLLMQLGAVVETLRSFTITNSELQLFRNKYRRRRDCLLEWLEATLGVKAYYVGSDSFRFVMSADGEQLDYMVPIPTAVQQFLLTPDEPGNSNENV